MAIFYVKVVFLRHLWHLYEDIPLHCLAVNSADCQRCVKATLTLILIYFRGIMRVIMKIEKREIKFSCGVIAWIFLLIFYFSKIERKWLAKDSFSTKNQKDMLYDGSFDERAQTWWMRASPLLMPKNVYCNSWKVLQAVFLFIGIIRKIPFFNFY